MSSKILLKKSTTASSVPLTSDLDVGEVAINTEDKRLYTKDSGGSVVEVSTTPSTLAVTGNATVGGTMGVTGNTTVGGTLGVTGATTLGTATVSTKLTVPTPTDSTDAASKGYVDTEITSAVTNVIDSAPGALDTLNELAAALGDDPNFATTVTNSIATKLPKDGSEAMSGNLNLGTNKIVNVVNPTDAQDAATKTYVDTADATKLSLSGGTMSGPIAMGTSKITGLGAPTDATDAATKGYIDSVTGSLVDAADSAADAEKLAINPEDSQYTLSDGTTTGFSALHYAAKASDSATSASDAQTAAEAAQTAAETAYDNFDDRYLGAKATAPAFDNDGQALITGAMYFDTTAGAMYVYDGSAWDQVALTPGDFLTVNNNLSDLQSAATAISNLGITATAAELNFVDGVTSNIQTQIDNINVDPTKGTLTKSFANGETASITLSGAISPAPVVSVTKEVAQTGITSKGGWDVATDGSNYELHDTAYDTTLTPSLVVNNVNTWTYDNKSLVVASQETGPNGLAFNNDGTKMYITGSSGDDVNQYTLSTAFDISTASFDSVTFSVAAQETAPTSLQFNNDGTKMYILGSTGDDVNQYTLSTAFDISTASFDSVTFSVASEDTLPYGLNFNNDGTKMYIVGVSTDTVYQYTLSTAFDISTASYDSVSLDISGQEANPRDIEFNSDGTKMFLGGAGDEEINQYTLSTPYDISTASYDSLLLSLSSEDGSPSTIVFSSDFTKLFIMGNSTDTVYQYSVGSEALILGSGSFASTDVGKRIVGNGGEAILTATDGSYSVVTAFDDDSTIASGDWSMFALTFDNTDGVKIGGIVNGFADASTWSYDDVSFSVASEESAPQGITFNSDGTKMYIVGSGSDTVFQYTLSTAFNLGTASYDSVSFSVASQETVPTGIVFNNDGTKMYIVGSTGDDVNQYSLSTAFDLSTASFDSVTFSVASQETNPVGIAFNTDGTKMYIAGSAGDDVNQYTLSTAFDISTASFDSVTFSITSQGSNISDIAFNNDGTKMYLVANGNDTVFQYSLSTAFDISTASYDSVSFSVNTQNATPLGVVFNNDGTKMYISGAAVTGTVYQYSTGSLLTPTNAYHPTVTKTSGQISTEYWTDINTMTADETLNGGEVYYAVSTDDRTTWAVIDNTDGVRPIVRNNAGTWEYNDASTYDGTTWTSASTNEELYALQEALEDGVAEEAIGFQDASEWSYNSVSFSVASEDTIPWGIAFNTDGTKMFIVGEVGQDVNEYALSTAYDISTASFTTNFSVGSQEADPTGIEFNNDGTKMYIVGVSGDDVNQYTLSTAFDVSTASFDSVTFSVASQESVPRDLVFNNDGTKMFIVGTNGDEVNEYALGTAFDISTASFTTNFSVASEDTLPRSIAFKNDGTKMYITGATSASIYQYTLSTAYDISTASYDSITFDPSSQDSGPVGIVFNSDGTKMYIVGNTADTVFQYTTGSTSNLNRMNSTQLNAVTDPNHYTLGDTLDLAIMLYTESAGSIPESDGVSINYDAEALNQGAVLGTDYDFDFPDSTTVRITSNAAQNLKVRVV